MSFITLTLTLHSPWDDEPGLPLPALIAMGPRGKSGKIFIVSNWVKKGLAW